MKHLKTVPDFNGDLEELAQQVGNLRYDSLEEFLTFLADDLVRQGDADGLNGRTKLSTQLYKTAEVLYQARDEMTATWDICEPYMKDE